MNWLDFVWEMPEDPMHQPGLDAAPPALARLEKKTIVNTDPRLPGVLEWIRTYGPHSNSLGLMGPSGEIWIDDACTLTLAAPQEQLRSALLRPSLRSLPAHLRVEIETRREPRARWWRRTRPHAGAPADECLLCGHAWLEHDPSEDVCSECRYEVEHGEAAPSFSPCRLIPHAR